VRDDVIAFGENELNFIAQRVGRCASEVEQPVAARRDMSAVLDIAVEPIALSRSVVTPVEERVKRFENKRLVLFRRWTLKLMALRRRRDGTPRRRSIDQRRR
jgi:hypothetical protein